MSGPWYPLALKAAGRTVFLLWASDDWALDRVLASAGQAIWFPDEDAARQYARAEHLTLAPEEELHLHDLVSAIRWLHTDSEPECRLLLDIWNLAADIARSVNAAFEDRGEALDDIYNKLFFGNNLPSMTPPGEHYQPQWTDDELALLHVRIQIAVDLIRSHVTLPA